MGRGLLWLARSLELANEAGSELLDGPIRINLADWAGQLSRPLGPAPMRHAAPIMSLAFRNGGRALVSVDKDRVARVWDMTTGSELAPSREAQLRDPLGGELNVGTPVDVDAPRPLTAGESLRERGPAGSTSGTRRPNAGSTCRARGRR